MDFGDILKNWEALEKSRREESKKEKAKNQPGPGKKANAPLKPKPGARDSGEAGGRSAVSRASPPLGADKVLERWLARNGVEDKDADREKSQSEDKVRAAQRLKRLKPQAFLDLHGKTAQEAEILLASFLASSQRQGLEKVLVIHGKGNHSPSEHVMTDLVRRALEGSEKAGAFGPADREQGGAGATWVILRAGSYFSR